MNLLQDFLVENDHIQFATPDSPSYADLRTGFTINAIKSPRLIVRPRSADDVSALVSILTANHLPFTVRAGGHDMWGRSQADDAVTIDLREICHVRVDDTSQSAWVGGGVIILDLIKELKNHNLVVPHAVTPTVGFVGWAIYGGYGLLSTKYGLGVDQILGATVVDAQGNIREADEKMLTVIRGGGGTVGIIVDLKIKVYPLDQVLAGAIIYQPNELVRAIRDFNDKLHQAKHAGIPKELGLFPFVMNGHMGKALTVLFVWASSDLDEGQNWLSQVSSWAPIATSTVEPTTIAEFNEKANSLVPDQIYGTVYTSSFRSLTPEVIEVICKHTPLQPNYPETLFGIHELRPDAPMVSPDGSIFNSRYPHVIIEVLAMTGSIDTMDEVLVWGQRFHDALMKTDATNITVPYIPLTPSDRTDLKAIYGGNFDTLQTIKAEYDPDGVFENALVQP